MKKSIYALTLLVLVVVSGLVFANRQIKNEPVTGTAPKPLSAAEKEAAIKQWEATPEGQKYKKWTVSPAGQKVLAGASKIRNQINSLSNMEAVITSLSLPAGSRLGFGVMGRIADEEYILTFGVEETKGYQQLRSLKVGDKILIKGRAVSHAPKYSYPIISINYVERDGKMIYKWVQPKGGC